jgi:putative lumazine-binding protein
MTSATISGAGICVVAWRLLLMACSDVASSAQLHGLRDGKLRLLAAQEYRNALASPSPKSRSAPRQQEILLVDFASPTQAMVRVRVRIDAILYLDYLAHHCIDGAWLITAKSFHIERRYEVAPT